MSIYALVILRGSTNLAFPYIPPGRWLHRATSRSSLCCQWADAACSCPAPVGRRSWGSTPTAARQTATSPRKAAVGWLPSGSHIGCSLLSLARSRTSFARSITSCDRSSGTRSKRDDLDLEGLSECPEARLAVLGQWIRLGEAPVEHGRHVAGGVEFPSCGRSPQEEEWVRIGFNRQREEMCSEGRPRRLASDFSDDLVGLAVEHLTDLRSNEVLGCDVEAVGVALD
jgi:hypothetical protein